MRTRDPADTEGWAAVASVAAIGSGSQVLDVGCGVGDFARWASARGAVLSGVDISVRSLERARLRTPDADLRHAAMERLPWLDESFDVVTGFNAFQYALDPGAALLEAARVVRPGGIVAVCRWGPPAANELFGLLARVQSEQLPPLHPADRDADLEAVVGREYAALVAAGLAPARWGTVERPATFADDAALATALVRAGASGVGALDPHDLASTLAPYRRADGSLELRNVLVYVTAVRSPEEVAPRS